MKRSRKYPYELVTDVYLCLLILFLLYFDSNGLSKISAAKRTGFYAIAAGYLLAVLVIALVQIIRKKLFCSDFVRLGKNTSWSQRLIGLYLIFSCISALLSPYLGTVLLGATRYEGLFTITAYCVTYFLVSVFAKPKKLTYYLLFVVITLFLIICFLQIIGKNPFSLYPSFYPKASYGRGFLGTVGNYDSVSAVLSLAIPLLWVPIVRTKSKDRFLLLIPLVLCLYLLYRIQVAAGIVGILCGTFFAVPFLFVFKKTTKRWIWLLYLYIILGVFVVLWAFDWPSQTMHEFHLILHGKIENSFGSYRIGIWKSVLQRAQERPLFGYGPDTMFHFRIKDYALLKNTLQDIEVADVAHNEYLNIFFHQGIFALLAYLGALISLLKRFIAKSPYSPQVSIFGVAVLCYCVQAFFGISHPIVSPFFWGVLGLLENRLREIQK